MSKEKRKWLEENGLDRETCPYCGGTGHKPAEGAAAAKPDTIRAKAGVKATGKKEK